MGGKVEQIAVIGTGTLGSQIAMVAADAGCTVSIYDQQAGRFERAVATIRSTLEGRATPPLVPWDRWEPAMRAVRRAVDLGQAVSAADLVIEAVPEDLELKRQVFAQIAARVTPDAILATNSSSIPVSRLEEASGRPERCLNLHFYQPLLGMNMVDVMGGTRTLPEVMTRGIEWVRSLRCIPLTVRQEIPGFCFNRVWRAVKKEALYMWANGFVDFRDVDRAWMVFTGMDRGPFGLMDTVGLDVVHDIEMQYYGESRDPKDQAPDALQAMVARGELGVKSGKGFYTYPGPEYLRSDFLDPSGGSTEPGVKR